MDKPSFKGFLGNWARTDMSLLEKIRVATRNNLIKLRTGSTCCGHPGEPGC